MLRASYGEEPFGNTEKDEEKEKENKRAKEDTLEQLANFELEQKKKEGDDE